MASEAAKELAAKQKAERKAAKLAKKTSNDPKDWGFVRQLRETYKITKEHDKELYKWLGIGFGVVFVLVSCTAFFLNPWWVYPIFGLFLGITADLYVLMWRAKKAMYNRFDGQPGAAEVAFTQLNKKKWAYEPAISWNKQMDVLHRVVGPAGIVLVGEGSPARLRPMLASEVRKHEQVAYGVPVTSVIMGDGDGCVPLAQLAKFIKKLPKKVDKLQLSEAKSRLKALDAMRPKVPVPRGPMPSMKGMARAVRGR
ncbi:MAG: DUF4191 domain-containing protein [Propionibacteriaceae bacterium]|jgi:hypothetical protein|nr:DUF4191 domain-containing protein [Propionibacteriaceae bacterium]